MAFARVTFSSTQLSIRDNLAKVQRQFESAALPATTGLRVNNLFDDPGSTSRIFSLKSNLKDVEQFQKNVTSARTRITFAEDQLRQSIEVIRRIRESALRANDPTVSASSLSSIEDSINELKDQLLGHANAKLLGKYVFAGTDTDTQPFTGTPTTFNGNSTAISIQATTTVSIQVNLDGDEIFTGGGGGVDIFAAIDDLATAVGSGDADDIETNLDLLDTATEQVLSGIAETGLRTMNLENVENTLSDNRLRYLEDLSDLQDANMDQALTDLVTSETALRLVFASTQRIMSVTSSFNVLS